MRNINVVAKKMARNGLKIANSLGCAFRFESEFTYLQVHVPIRFCLLKYRKANNFNPMIDMSYASKVPHTVNQNINDARTSLENTPRHILHILHSSLFPASSIIIDHFIVTQVIHIFYPTLPKKYKSRSFLPVKDKIRTNNV